MLVVHKYNSAAIGNIFILFIAKEQIIIYYNLF